MKRVVVSAMLALCLAQPAVEAVAQTVSDQCFAIGDIAGQVASWRAHKKTKEQALDQAAKYYNDEIRPASGRRHHRENLPSRHTAHDTRSGQHDVHIGVRKPAEIAGTHAVGPAAGAAISLRYRQRLATACRNASSDVNAFP